MNRYCGHRVQHDVEYLWRTRHSFHHQVGTPSPVTTVYIDKDDATLQVGRSVTRSLVRGTGELVRILNWVGGSARLRGCGWVVGRWLDRRGGD